LSRSGPGEPVARHAHADDLGLLARERLPVEPQVRHDARAEVVDDDVGAERERLRDGARARIAEVEPDAPLAAHERAREPAAPVAEVERVLALDLDHVGAEIGQDAGGDRVRRRPT
jgi:hypothetical protein